MKDGSDLHHRLWALLDNVVSDATMILCKGWQKIRPKLTIIRRTKWQFIHIVTTKLLQLLSDRKMFREITANHCQTFNWQLRGNGDEVRFYRHLLFTTYCQMRRISLPNNQENSCTLMHAFFGNSKWLQLHVSEHLSSNMRHLYRLQLF